MKFVRLLIGIVTVLTVGMATAATTALDPDGGIRLDGKRWFPLGLYEVPEDATASAETRAAGFDLVRADADLGHLDILQAAGLKAWIPLGGYSTIPDTTAAQRLLDHIAPLQSHPALALWELPDEALWNIRESKLKPCDQEREEVRERVNDVIRSGSPEAEELKALYRDMVRYWSRQDHDRCEEAIKKIWTVLGEPERALASTLSLLDDEEPVLFWNLLNGYRQLRGADPHHLVWQNHAPRNSFDLLEKHAAYCDIIGCDIYPAPDDLPQGHSDLASRRLSSVGDYTRIFGQAAPAKGVLMVLQGFGWRQISDIGDALGDTDKGREPRFLEQRFMAYDAVVNGAKGLAYWGTPYDRKDSGKTWKELVPVIQEMASLQAFLAAPETPHLLEITPVSSWFSHDLPVVVSARQVGEDWLFVLVNRDEAAQRIHLGFPTEFAGKKMTVLYQGVGWEVEEGAEVELDFVGYGVHLISTRSDLEVPELRVWDREIRDPFPGN